MILINSVDVEDVLIDAIKQELQNFDLEAQFPNFSPLKISKIHPFLVILGDARADLGLFPSLTVGDMSAVTSASVLNRDGREMVFNDVSGIQQALIDMNIKGSKSFVDGLTDMLAQNNGRLIGRVQEHAMKHSVAISIWSQNRDFTSALWEIIILLFNEQNFVENVAAKGVYLMSEALSGRRTGDINLELGGLIYGASIDVIVDAHRSIFKLLDGGLVDIAVSAPNA